MSQSFEDLAWMFARSREQAEFDVTEGAMLWRTLGRTTGSILEIGRRRGDSTLLCAAAAESARIVSYGRSRPVDGDVDRYATRHSLRRRIELHTGTRPHLDEPDFTALVVHLQGGYLQSLTRLLIGWRLIQDHASRRPTVVVVIREGNPTNGPSTRYDDDWRKISDGLHDSGSCDLIEQVGRIQVMHVLGDAPIEPYVEAAVHLRDARDYDNACRFHRHALDKSDQHAEAWHEYGRSLLAHNQLDKAEQALRKAVGLHQSHHYLNNLALVLMRQSRADDAIPLLRECLRLQPNYVHGLNNLGWAMEETGNLDQAISLLRQATVANPDYVHGHYNLGRCLIAAGELEEGWERYEWRWKLPRFPTRRRNYDIPLWDGSDLGDKSIVLWSEQGIGDQMAFASMLPDIVDQGATGVIECSPKLIALMQRSFPTFVVVEKSVEISEEITSRTFDFQAPFGRLGRFVRPNVSAFPDTARFLRPDPDKVAYWKNRLDSLDDQIKVGIAWTSRNTKGFRSKHYLMIDDLEPLLRIDGCTFICVQYGECESDIERARREFGTRFIVFDDLDLFDDIDAVVAMTASLDIGIASKFSSCLDMMAINDVPVLTFSRGMTERNMGTHSVPWYPSARIFQCDIGSDSTPVVQQMAKALAEFVESSRGRLVVDTAAVNV